MPNNGRKSPVGIPQGLMVRSAIEFRPSTLREDDRSVEFVLATETPALVWDWDRCDVITEVLSTDGVQLPKNRQVPLIDSHNTRESVKKILGSVRQIRNENGQIIGRLFFARDAQSEFDKVRDGHITSGSVGYQPMARQWIDEDTSTEYNGKSYSGPMMLTKTWRLGEYSLVTIPADENATARAETQAVHSRKAESIQEETKMSETTTPTPPANPAADELKRQLAEAEKARAEAEKTKQEAIVRAERLETDGKIKELCARFSVPDLAEKLVSEKADLARAQTEILEALSARTKPMTGAQTPEIIGGTTDGEKFTRAATDAMLVRIHGDKIKERAPGSEQMSRISFLSLAQECVRRNHPGINVAFMGKEQVYEMALRSSSAIPNLGLSSFPSILANVATKSMMVGWDYAPSTYEIWCQIGDLPDFKAARRVQISSAPALLEVPEFAEVTHGVMQDTGESIQLVTLARKLVISRQALVNDDLGYFDRIFTMFGSRARAIVNRLPYVLLATNDALADQEELFSSAHANTANNALTTANLATGYEAMFQQVSLAPGDGVDAGIPLNLTPKYLLVGYANLVNSDILCGSLASTDTDKNSGVKNPYNRLIPVPDANITTNAGKQWYLVADQMQVPTVEVAFLDGRREPMLTQENTSPVLGMDFTAVLDVTAKALDHRGLYRGEGG